MKTQPGAKHDDDAGTDAVREGACFDPSGVHAFCSDLLAGLPSSKSRTAAPALEPWLRASDIAPDARLVAIGGFGALALVGPGAGVARAVLAPPLDDSGAGPVLYVLPITWPGAGSDVRAIDVWGSQLGQSPELVVLLCSATSCILAGASPGTDMMLAPLPVSQAPPDVAPIGLTSIDGNLCVFGNGLSCLHGGGFVPEIAPRPGLMLRDVVEGDPSIAVGDHGELFLHESGANAKWIEQLTRTQHDLVVGSADSQAWWAASASGSFLEAAAQDTVTCAQTPAPRALALRSGPFGNANIEIGTVVDDHGNVFARFPSDDGPTWCRGNGLQFMPAERVTGTTSILCGYNRRLLVLTPQAIHSAPVMPGDHSWSWKAGRDECVLGHTL